MATKVNSQTRQMPGVDEIAEFARHNQDVVYVCADCHHLMDDDECDTCGDSETIPYTYSAATDGVNVGDLR